ncbi:DNA polymerase III subunit delta [Candidatus Solincola tengchongensis]|uniref:DNA polymerase III subunit delta n=1 Tax=Candidatus Solincola tengchongensis TaxID=2900693 RepID=UPI00258017AA|nr:DNA polymerase III subunit delta [Candidatus Solincola tengchongensis]
MSEGRRVQAVLIHGEQALLLEEELRKILKRVSRNDPEMEFNLDVFRMGEDSLEEALAAAETLPLAGGWRYVVVRDAQMLSPKEVRLLASFLDRPPESAVLILMAAGLKKSSPLLKACREKVLVVEATLSRKKVPLWIKSRFEARGLRVNGRAIPYLLEMLGEDLMALEAAVEKIALFHQGDRPVELEEVVALVMPSAEKAVYELTDRVMLGDTDQALKILRRLLKQGEDPNRVLFILTRHYLRLLNYMALRDEGLSDREIAAELKLPANMEWMLSSRLRPQASLLGEKGLRHSLSALLEAERDLKTGRMEPGDALMGTVIRLASMGRS